MNFNEKVPSYLQLQNSRGLVTGSTSCEGPERQVYHQETAATEKEAGFITSYLYTEPLTLRDSTHKVHGRRATSALQLTGRS